MSVLIWFRKSCVLELGKEPADDDSLVELGLLEWTVKNLAREWKVTRCLLSAEPQLTDRSLNKLHLCILAVTICKELAAASTKESILQTWCEMLRIGDEELREEVICFHQDKFVGH